MTTLTKLQADAEKARATYEKAQADAVAAHQAAEQRRDAALAEHDRARLNAYTNDAAALEAEVEAATERLRAAVLADPMMAALIDVYDAQLRRYMHGGEAVGAAARLGVDAPAGRAGVAGAPDLAAVLKIVAGEASGRAADWQDARDADRTAAGEQAAQ